MGGEWGKGSARGRREESAAAGALRVTRATHLDALRIHTPAVDERTKGGQVGRDRVRHASAAELGVSIALAAGGAVVGARLRCAKLVERE